ncbi:MmgE/PrpD family protein [Aureimonas fodinaquatilis]|uniref:MmgE/PrpD family protein n=1 Tax=Aureimonas fodinaquatilis TaxID=2565783 RepID=A0A5B0E1Z2_9HYPH|nr:MmgE/PrpD family protein [Aureimonas fodinaquatilis]KAA0971750.1 MmgE/PrpD family protein [Aureimonas fodinaquatilis]
MSLLHCPDNDGKTIAATLAGWLVRLDASTIPGEAVTAARRALIDVAGVMHAGLDMPLARLVREEAIQESASGPASVPGTGLRFAPVVAARVNSTAAHVLDFDANFNRGMVFGPAVLFPALLALGEAENTDGSTVLNAFAIGTEVCRTLAESLSPRPYTKSRDSLFYLGWFNTGVLGPIGVAAACGWMMKLPAEQMRNAIAIAAVQACGLRIGVGSDMKPLMAARASETGLRAALLARRGVLAPADAMEGHRGFIQVVNGGKWTPDAFDALGSFQDAGPSFKLYPACSSVQAAAEALDAILQQSGIAGEQVETVTCEVTNHIASNLAFDDPQNVTQAQFSISYALGCILADGEFSYRHLTAEKLASPAIRSAMTKISMQATLDFDDEVLERASPEATRVIVRTSQGAVHDMRLNASTGKPVNPMSDEMLERKFLSNTRDRLGMPAAKALLARLNGIDQIGNLQDLFSRAGEPA